MSAEDLGTRELGQVRSQRLDEFLTTLRLLHDPSTNSRIGIPALDKLLANSTTRFDPTNLSAIPATPIIEITSPDPKSGKTELLYWIIANLVLGSDKHDTSNDVLPDESTRELQQEIPDQAKDVETSEPGARRTDGGENLETDITQHDPTTEQPERQLPPSSTNLPREAPSAQTAIALLTTSPPNIPRLSQNLLHRLLSSPPHLSLSTAQETIHTALSHIHIFQPTSLSSLIATLASLPTYFLDAQNGSAERRLGAIIVDSPSTYFWADKLSTQSQGQGQAQQSQSKYPALASTLKRVSTTLSAPVIFSTAHLAAITSTSSVDSSSGTQTLRPQLPSPFSTLPTLRLVISRNAVQGFGKDVDAETVVKYQDGRNKAVREGRFRVLVNRWESEGRGNVAAGRDGGGSGNAGFEVKIDDMGVTVL